MGLQDLQFTKTPDIPKAIFKIRISKYNLGKAYFYKLEFPFVIFEIFSKTLVGNSMIKVEISKIYTGILKCSAIVTTVSLQKLFI